MIRILIYLLAVGILAGAAAWFADNPGSVLIRWRNYEAETSVGTLIIGTLLLAALGYGAIRALRLIARGPAAFAALRAQRRRARKLHFVVRGFSAAAIGDGAGARKALKAAEGGDDLAGLKRLLAAQVAEIDRDEAAAEAAYRDLLKHPDTEFLGLRGLYETALRLGDREAALAFATRAFEAKPRSPWLAEQLFRVQTQAGSFDLARKTISTLRRSGALSAEAARRREGVLLAAEAISAEAAGDAERAFSIAQKSLVLAPGLTPMAILLAKAHTAQAQIWAAAGTLENAWRIHPHPDIAALYRTLKIDETDQQRARRMMGLAEFNPNHVESRLLVAQEALQLGELRRARRALKPALELPSARIFMLMSEIALKAGGGEAEAQAFRARAVSAPRDAQWACSSCSRERTDWIPVCDGCGGFDTYAWGSQGALAGAGLIAPSALPGTIDWKEDLAEAAPLPPDAVAPEPAAPAAESDRTPVHPFAPAETSTGSEMFTPPRQPDDPGTGEEETVLRFSY